MTRTTTELSFAVLIALCGSTLFAQAQGGRESFMKQQAYAEMQRVSGQMDVLQNNVDELQHRVSRLEGGNQTQSLRAEIDSLKASIAELRRELANQRGEIVKDLSGRIAKMQPKQEPAPAPQKPAKPAYTGPCSEYVVQNGDSLYMIALAFKTSVERVKEMNNLKNNNLRVGQKLLVPKVKE